MKVTVKLLGILRQGRFKQRVFDLPPGSPVGYILGDLSISWEEMKIGIISINDKPGNDFETILNENDVLTLFIPFGDG